MRFRHVWQPDGLCCEPGGKGWSRLETVRNLAIPGPAAEGGVGLRVVDSGGLVLAGQIVSEND